MLDPEVPGAASLLDGPFPIFWTLSRFRVRRGPSQVTELPARPLSSAVSSASAAVGAVANVTFEPARMFSRSVCLHLPKANYEFWRQPRGIRYTPRLRVSPTAAERKVHGTSDQPMLVDVPLATHRMTSCKTATSDLLK